MNEAEIFLSISSLPILSARAIRSSVSSRNVESAPCLVVEPTSSLSNSHSTGMALGLSHLRKPSSVVNAHSRSSSLPAEKYSPSLPHTVAGVRLYRYRSWPSMSFSSHPASSATRFLKLALPE